MESNSTKFELMPEYLSTRHLIQLGIYPSTDAAYQARCKGNSPDFIKLKHKILFPKQAVLEFLESRMRSGEERKEELS
jgi:hypothetical protein